MLSATVHVRSFFNLASCETLKAEKKDWAGGSWAKKLQGVEQEAEEKSYYIHVP